MYCICIVVPMPNCWLWDAHMPYIITLILFQSTSLIVSLLPELSSSHRMNTYDVRVDITYLDICILSLYSSSSFFWILLRRRLINVFKLLFFFWRFESRIFHVCIALSHTLDDFFIVIFLFSFGVFAISTFFRRKRRKNNVWC